MKVPWILCLCCPSLLLFPAGHLSASIRLDGLADDPILEEYIAKVALSPYRKQPEQLVPLAKVRSDIEKALKAQGYYDPKVILDEGVETVFRVEPGSRYTINDVKITGIDLQSDLPLQRNDSLIAQSVLDAQKQILNEIVQKQCIYNHSVRHEVSLDHDSRTADITFIVEGDPDARFGATEFKGSESIKRSYLSRFLAYREGECWTVRKISETRTALLETGLLNSVDFDFPDTLPESRKVPMTLLLRERNSQKVRLGSHFSTWEGPGVSAEWRNMNSFGAGEDVSVSARASEFLQSLGLEFTKPFFLSKKQSLNIATLAKRQDTDAFEESSFHVKSSVSRSLSKLWRINTGVAFEASTIREEFGSEETFGLVSLPLQLTFDNRDNPLDPHKGYNLGFWVEPFADTFGNSNPFFKSRITGTTYLHLGDFALDPVLALRSSAGSILGPSTEDLPASKRFYAGGGGSVRGFGFQEAGPVDTDNEPLGGRSIVEATAELRLRFSDKLGCVTFVDVGSVYNKIVPELDKGVFVGAGLGMRYYSNFGPFRLDVATPVNRKDFADQAIQVYVSIGQAF